MKRCRIVISNALSCGKPGESSFSVLARPILHDQQNAVHEPDAAWKLFRNGSKTGTPPYATQELTAVVRLPGLEFLARPFDLVLRKDTAYAEKIVSGICSSAGGYGCRCCNVWFRFFKLNSHSGHPDLPDAGPLAQNRALSGHAAPDRGIGVTA
jgi:hypothetical protein